MGILLPDFASAAVPAHIRRHEVARVERFAPGNGNADARVRIRAHGRNFDFTLEPSPTLAAHAETVFVGPNGVRREPSAQVLFHGRLADDPDALVRVAVTDSSLIGSVTSGAETWYFEPLRRFEPGAAADRTVVYRASDIDASALPPLGCAAEHADASVGAPLTAAATPPVLGASPGVLELTLVADYKYFAIHGSDSAASMQAVIDQVAAFYPVDLGVTVSVVQTVIHQSPDPFTTSTDSLQVLNSLAGKRSTQPATYGAGDITHLFTGRDLDQNIIGIAYVGTVCDQYYAASVAQDFHTDLHLLTLLTGHELGHSLGAYHDGQDSSPCEDASYGYVMWPSLQSGLAEQFSTCSRSSIAPVVTGAACIDSSISSDCGNGVVDSGEECDDGGNLAGDCCRQDCSLDASGSSCGGDGNACTDDVCNGAGLCVHPDSVAACDDGNACSADGHCSGGLCVSTGELEPAISGRLKARFRPESDDDSLMIRAVLGAALASPPTANGVTVRFLDGAGGLLHESHAAAANWTDKRGTGRRYVYDGDDTPLPSGLTSMSVQFKPAASVAKVKARFADRDLPFLAERSSVGVQVLVGDAAAGDCGSAMAMTCKVSDGRLTCS
ncbi:MAG: M12 family metallo-peptidase [Candidatus Binatia bacterium]